jgi:pentatricopeptide repeat protein
MLIHGCAMAMPSHSCPEADSSRSIVNLTGDSQSYRSEPDILTQALLDKAREVRVATGGTYCLPRTHISLVIAIPGRCACLTDHRVTDDRLWPGRHARPRAQLYHEMKLLRLRPTTDTLNSLIVACSKAGQLERAFAIFEYNRRHIFIMTRTLG